MESAIQNLVNMGDIDSLFEVMTENEDFMYCLDAAEGLVVLGDKRGIEFLVDATQSEDEDISAIAQEILDSPEIRRKRDEIEIDKKQEREAMTETAKKRIREGKKVFIYKTVYLASSFFISDESSEEGESVPALNDFGFEGWEVAAFIGKASRATPLSPNGSPSGGYFILKKQVFADEISELDEL
jgi:hypothetical protein